MRDDYRYSYDDKHPSTSTDGVLKTEYNSRENTARDKSSSRNDFYVGNYHRDDPLCYRECISTG